MNLYDSITYRNDLEYVIKKADFLHKMINCSVLITGATGLICSGIVDLLLINNEMNDTKTHIYVAGRNEKRARERFASYFDSDYFHFVTYDASRYNQFEFQADYIIHGASNAYPAAIQEHPVETMLDNFIGMYELLEYARKTNAKRCLFISSSEVYGAKMKADPFMETEYGYIDLLNPRSSYSSGKRAAETLCASYGKEYGLDTVIIRPGHIYGPTASQNDNRVSSAFAFDVINGKNLVLKSTGSQIRSYCYVLDCATAILTALLCGQSGEAYNVSNPESVMTIRQMAELFSSCGGVELKFDIPTEVEKAGFNPMSNSSLNSEKLQSLGWKGHFDSEKGVEHTVRVLTEANRQM